MFKDIQIDENRRENLLLFDNHEIVVRRGNGNNAELVIYPCHSGNLTVRYAKTPYQCRLNFKKGSIDIDLADESDWGNIELSLDNPRWGNEEDGYRDIVSVELFDGCPHGTNIPLDVFAQDVRDFIIYYEG